MIKIKLTVSLHAEIIRDLTRPHSFASERVGFVSGRTGTLEGNDWLILLTGYHSIPDEQYVKDLSVGARIDSNAITWAMQAAYYGRPAKEGIFHIHLHRHRSETGMSGTDLREIPKIISGFQSVSPEASHGIIILSIDHGSGWVWLSGREEALHAASIAVIGAPIKVFLSGRKK